MQKPKQKMITKEEMMKSIEISSEIQEIMEQKEEFTRSDLQGAIEAQIMKAIQFGKSLK